MGHLLKTTLLIATLFLAANASAQTPRSSGGSRAAEVDAIYPGIEKLYIDLHRNPELAFQEQRTAATLAARVKAWDTRSRPASAAPESSQSSGTAPARW